MFTLPSSFTKFGKALNTKLEEVANSSLVKSEHIKSENKVQLDIWKAEYSAKINERINAHLQSANNLSEAEQVAVAKFRESID